CRTLPTVASGVVKSTATSAPPRSRRSSPASYVCPRERSPAADTAFTTSEPIRPAAPITATVTTTSASRSLRRRGWCGVSGGDLVGDERHDGIGGGLDLGEAHFEVVEVSVPRIGHVERGGTMGF